MVPLLVCYSPTSKSAPYPPSPSTADDAKNMTEEEGWHFVDVGEQHTFGVNTAGLDDKATACQMLVCYARELKQGFADYAEQVVKIMVANLTFYYEDNILFKETVNLKFWCSFKSPITGNPKKFFPHSMPLPIHT